MLKLTKSQDKKIAAIKANIESKINKTLEIRVYEHDEDDQLIVVRFMIRNLSVMKATLTKRARIVECSDLLDLETINKIVNEQNESLEELFKHDIDTVDHALKLCDKIELLCFDKELDENNVLDCFDFDNEDRMIELEKVMLKSLTEETYKNYIIKIANYLDYDLNEFESLDSNAIDSHFEMINRFFENCFMTQQAQLVKTTLEKRDSHQK